MPDRLLGREVILSGATTAGVTDAEIAVERLNRETRSLVDSEAVARLLLRAEAAASSKIEGLAIGGRRLLEAQVAAALGRRRRTSPRPKFSTPPTRCGGRSTHWPTWRRSRSNTCSESTNWIGGSSHNPCSATFVPPPCGRVLGLLEDLCEFCNGEELAAIAQAALAHAQFETIHPFIDGNGRTGRALIHVILRRRGLAPVLLPPVSLALATWSKDYANGLTGPRYRSDASSQEALDGLDYWVGLFAAAMRRAVEDAETYEQRVAEVQAAWREATVTANRARSDSRPNLCHRD